MNKSVPTAVAHMKLFEPSSACVGPPQNQKTWVKSKLCALWCKHGRSAVVECFSVGGTAAAFRLLYTAVGKRRGSACAGSVRVHHRLPPLECMFLFPSIEGNTGRRLVQTARDGVSSTLEYFVFFAQARRDGSSSRYRQSSSTTIYPRPFTYISTILHVQPISHLRFSPRAFLCSCSGCFSTGCWRPQGVEGAGATGLGPPRPSRWRLTQVR